MKVLILCGALIGLSTLAHVPAHAESLEAEYSERAATADQTQTDQFANKLFNEEKRECMAGINLRSHGGKIIQSHVTTYAPQGVGETARFSLTVKTSNGFICRCDFDYMGLSGEESGDNPNCVR